MQSQSHNEMFSLVQDILINYIQKSFKIKKLVSKKLKYAIANTGKKKPKNAVVKNAEKRSSVSALRVSTKTSVAQYYIMLVYQ